MNRSPPSLLGAVVVTALLAAPSSSRAHAGEDHGEAPPPPATGSGVRSAAATTTAVELVVRWPADDATKGVPLRLLLSDYASNAPLEGADVEVTLAGASGETSAKATATKSPGVYQAALRVPANGSYAMSATIVAGDVVDVVAIPAVEVGPAAVEVAAAHAHDDERGAPLFAVAAVVVALLLVVAAVLLRRRRRAVATVTTAALAALLSSTLSSTAARAHAGEDHGEAPAARASARTSTTGAVFFAKESQFLLGVRTEVVTTRSVAERLRVPGVVALPPERHAAIFAPQAGRLMPPAGGFLRLGAKVKRGQVLGVLDAVLSAGERASFSAEAASARAAVAQASARLEAAKKQLARLESLEGVVARAERDAAEVEVTAAEAELAAARERTNAFSTSGGAARFELVSPLEGVLADVAVSPGEVLDQGSRAFLVIDPAELTVEAKVYESDLGRLAGGASALVTVDAYPGKTFEGHLVAQGQVVDEATRTVKVIFSVENNDALLKVGMFANVEIGAGEAGVALSVPDAAILDVEGRRVVYVHTAPEEFTPREVALGRRDGAYYEVRDGLSEGDRVVVVGAYSLKNAPAASR